MSRIEDQPSKPDRTTADHRPSAPRMRPRWVSSVVLAAMAVIASTAYTTGGLTDDPAPAAPSVPTDASSASTQPVEASGTPMPTAWRAGPDASALISPRASGLTFPQPISAASPPISGPSSSRLGAPTDSPAPRRPSPTAPSGPRSAVVTHGSRGARAIALTFDDGYAHCDDIVRILDRSGVRATFFPNSRYVRWNPRLWRRIAARYPIGNHTADHRVMTRLSYAAMLQQLRSDERTIEAITGRPMAKLFRPPYGAYNGSVLVAAHAAGYRTTVLWDIESADTSGATDAQVLARAARGTNGSIVLMHCGPSVTTRILGRLIARYRARGFRFVTVRQLLP